MEPIKSYIPSISQLNFNLESGTIIEGKAGKQIQVIGIQLSSDAAVNVEFLSDTELIMGYCLGASGGLCRQSGEDIPLFACNSGEDLIINVSSEIGSGENRYGYLQWRYRI